MAVRYLADIFALNELRKGLNMAPAARAWFDALPVNRLALAAPHLSDLWMSISQLGRTDHAAALRIAAWLNGVEASFSGRILEVDEPVSQCSIRLYSKLIPLGINPPLSVSMIAGMALVHELTLITPHPETYNGTDVKVVNPWVG